MRSGSLGKNSRESAFQVHRHALRLRSVWGSMPCSWGVLASFYCAVGRGPVRGRSAFLLSGGFARGHGRSPGPEAQVTGAGGAPACGLGCCCLAVSSPTLAHPPFWTLLSTWRAFSLQTPRWPGLLIPACVCVKYESSPSRAVTAEVRPLWEGASVSAGSYLCSWVSPERPPAELGSALGHPASPALATWLSLLSPCHITFAASLSVGCVYATGL